MFLFGWFLMKRLDRFLDENQKRIEEAPEQQQPEQCVHLAGNISPDELEEMLSRFRSSHAHVEIVIYDSEQISFPDNESDWAQLKPSHLGAIISFKRGCENVQNKGSELPKEHILVCLSSSPSNERIRLATAAEVLGLGLRSAKKKFNSQMQQLFAYIFVHFIAPQQSRQHSLFCWQPVITPILLHRL